VETHRSGKKSGHEGGKKKRDEKRRGERKTKTKTKMEMEKIQRRVRNPEQQREIGGCVFFGYRSWRVCTPSDVPKDRQSGRRAAAAASGNGGVFLPDMCG
jgi:hypothetical protein